VTLDCTMKRALMIVVCWFSQTVSWTWTWRNAWIAQPTWRPCGGGTARATICATRAACTTGSTEWIGRRSGLRRRKPPRYDTTRQTDYDYTHIILMYYFYAGILYYVVCIIYILVAGRLYNSVLLYNVVNH